MSCSAFCFANSSLPGSCSFPLYAMHALRYLLAFLLIVGSLVIAYLLLRPSYSPHSVPQPAQPVRLRPRLNASSADSLPPIASSAGVDPYDPITITDQAHRINTNPLPGKLWVCFAFFVRVVESMGSSLFQPESIDVSELDNLVVADCLVPRYAPYATVVQITNHSISVKINDPNDAKQTPAIAYKVYYWGHKLSPKGKPL